MSTIKTILQIVNKVIKQQQNVEWRNHLMEKPRFFTLDPPRINTIITKLTYV